MSAFPVKFTVVRPEVLPDELKLTGGTHTIIRKKLAEFRALGKTSPGTLPPETPELTRYFDSVESATEFKTFLVELFTNGNFGQDFVDSAANAVIETV